MAGRNQSIGRGKTLVIVLAVVALLAGTITALTTSSGNGDSSAQDDGAGSTSSTSAPTTSEPDVSLEDLSGPARELAELLAQGRTTTYHARYTGSSSTGDEEAITLESWAKDGRFRQDTSVDVADQVFQRSNFVLGDRAVACSKFGDAEWTCQEQAADSVEGSSVLTGGSLQQLRDAAVGESDNTVDDRPSRCFTITYDAQTTELCTTPEGVPLRISTQESQLQVEVLEAEVDDSVFEPPAPTES